MSFINSALKKLGLVSDCKNFSKYPISGRSVFNNSLGLYETPISMDLIYTEDGDMYLAPEYMAYLGYNVRIVHKSIPMKGVYGTYSTLTRTITISTKVSKGGKEFLEIVTHELQHALQDRDNRPGGSTVADWYTVCYQMFNSLVKYSDRPGYDVFLRGYIKDFSEKNLDFMAQAMAYKIYASCLGEVEARFAAGQKINCYGYDKHYHNVWEAHKDCVAVPPFEFIKCSKLKRLLSLTYYGALGNRSFDELGL